VERVVLNALTNIIAASPPDICAFGDYLSSSSEKTIYLRLMSRREDLEECSLLLPSCYERK